MAERNGKKSSVLTQWRNRKKSGQAGRGIPRRPEGARVFATSGQRRLWILQEMYPDNPFYQYGHVYDIDGPLDVEALRESLRKLVRQQELLLSNFVETEEGLLLVTRADKEVPLSLIELGQEAEKEARRRALQEAKKGFDLSRDPLLRMTLLKLGPRRHQLVLSMHHIIGDRQSLLIFQKSLFDHYHQIVGGGKLNLAVPPVQFADFAHWQNTQLPGQEDLKFWLAQLSGELPTLALPHDFSRPRQASYRGATTGRILSPELSRRIIQMAKKQSTTPFVLLLAAFNIFLYRYSRQEDILVGSPFSTRDKPELEGLIGFFNETLVLRSQLSTSLTFEQYLPQVRQMVMDALAHKDVALDELVRRLQPERHSNINPLFQAMFVYNQAATFSGLVPDLEVKDKPIDLGVSKFDLTLFATNDDRQIELSFEYALDLFDEETVARMLRHLERLLQSALDHPGEAISKLNILDEQEIRQIVVGWNETAAAVPEFDSITQWIETTAREYPDRTAVVDQHSSLSYRQLDDKAGTLAQLLVSAGVAPGNLVGLCAERSVELLTGILAVLKAGAAYLPLDPAYPSERLNYMLQDARAEVVLTGSALNVSFDLSGIKTIRLDTDLPAGHFTSVKTGDQQPAYMIYTSGSSGRPKGVPISHRNLIHSTAARTHFFEHQPEAFLLLSSFSFDSSVAGIFWTLCQGGTLVLPPRRIEQDMLQLSGWIKNHRITHTLLLPSLYQLLLSYAPKAALHTLQTVMVAGEASSAKLVSLHFSILPGVKLVNEYGPTEATVWSTAHHIRPRDAFGPIPIGRPIPNVRNYVLDQQLQPVPLGVIGELFIGGPGVARGYWQRPELTAARFFPNPFDAGDRLYRTGDLASYRPDGALLFWGRADQQLKIRGHRIEPDEIRAAIERIPQIREVDLQVQNENNHPRLVAFYALHPGKEAINPRALLQDQLPNYMIPAAFVQLDQLPRLPNGKIDRTQLPQTDAQAFAGSDTFQAPATPTEKQLAQVWERVLDLKPVGRHDNFFELGGDSIRSIQLIAKARQEGIELAPQHLFEYQNIAELAGFLERVKARESWSSVVPLNKGGARTPLFCIHSGGAHVFFYQPLAKYIDDQQPLYALQPSGLDGQGDRHESIEEMAEFYIQEMRRVQPRGPYQLLGTCFSNAVGLEMAHQLTAAGEKIEQLIFVDSGPMYLLGAHLRGGRQTLRRFGRMLRDRNWGGIKKKFRNRWIRSRQKLLAPLENEEERQLRLTIQSLNQLYHYYTWKPYDGRITFIRSSEFASQKEKNTHVTQWTKLAKRGLDIHVVPGHHKTLFAEPEVRELARTVEACLQPSPS